jgi:hypothetical protein
MPTPDARQQPQVAIVKPLDVLIKKAAEIPSLCVGGVTINQARRSPNNEKGVN